MFCTWSSEQNSHYTIICLINSVVRNKINCPMHFNGTSFSKPNFKWVSSLSFWAVIVAKHCVALQWLSGLFILIWAILVLVHGLQPHHSVHCIFFKQLHTLSAPLQKQICYLTKYLVTTIVWLSLLCKFYECSGSWYLNNFTHLPQMLHKH